MLGFWTRGAELPLTGHHGAEETNEILLFVQRKDRGRSDLKILAIDDPDRPRPDLIVETSGRRWVWADRPSDRSLSRLSVDFVVEAKPGASGMIGVDARRQVEARWLHAGGFPRVRRSWWCYLDPKSPFRPELGSGIHNPGPDARSSSARPDLPQKTLAAFLAAAKTDTRDSYGAPVPGSPSVLPAWGDGARSGTRMSALRA